MTLLVLRLLAGGFYWRHRVLLSLAALVLVGLVRPGYLLFTGMFIRSLLLNPGPAVAVALLAFAWSLYAAVSVRRAMRYPEHSFLVVLGALSGARLAALAACSTLSSGFLGYLYLGLMAYHAATLGQAWAILYASLALFALAAGTATLALRMARPVGASTGRRWLPAFRLGHARMLWEAIWREHSTALGIVKALSLLFTALLVATGFREVLPQIISLSFALSGLLQAVLPFVLRVTEDSKLLWLRGLPIPWWRRMSAHVAVHLLLQAPELILLILGTLSQQEHPGYLAAYLAAVMGTHLLGLGLTYLPGMTRQDYLRLMFGLFILTFIGLIFAVPVAYAQACLALLGVALCAQGTFRTDDGLGDRV